MLVSVVSMLPFCFRDRDDRTGFPRLLESPGKVLDFFNQKSGNPDRNMS